MSIVGMINASIVASSSLTDEHIEVLKQGDTFGLFDRYGDIHSLRTGSHGLYHEGTRFLSRFELTINGERPLLLSSTVNEKKCSTQRRSHESRHD